MEFNDFQTGFKPDSNVRQMDLKSAIAKNSKKVSETFKKLIKSK